MNYVIIFYLLMLRWLAAFTQAMIGWILFKLQLNKLYSKIDQMVSTQELIG